MRPVSVRLPPDVTANNRVVLAPLSVAFVTLRIVTVFDMLMAELKVMSSMTSMRLRPSTIAELSSPNEVTETLSTVGAGVAVGVCDGCGVTVGCDVSEGLGVGAGVGNPHEQKMYLSSDVSTPNVVSAVLYFPQWKPE